MKRNSKLIPWTKEKLLCLLNTGSYLQYEIHHLSEACGYKSDRSFKTHLDASTLLPCGQRGCQFVFGSWASRDPVAGGCNVFLCSAWAVINKGIEGGEEKSGGIYSILCGASSKLTFSEIYPLRCIVLSSVTSGTQSSMTTIHNEDWKLLFTRALVHKCSFNTPKVETTQTGWMNKNCGIFM